MRTSGSGWADAEESVLLGQAGGVVATGIRVAEVEFGVAAVAGVGGGTATSEGGGGDDWTEEEVGGGHQIRRRRKLQHRLAALEARARLLERSHRFNRLPPPPSPPFM